MTLSFTLGKGQFATAVLREICDLDAARAIGAMRGASSSGGEWAGRAGCQRSNTYTAPVPPSMARAEVNARTSGWRLSQVFTAIFRTGPRDPER